MKQYLSEVNRTLLKNQPTQLNENEKKYHLMMKTP